MPNLEKRLRKAIKNQKSLKLDGLGQSARQGNTTLQAQEEQVKFSDEQEYHRIEDDEQGSTSHGSDTESETGLQSEQDDEDASSLEPEKTWESYQNKQPKSEVDDEFFSLEQMEEFVRQQEKDFEEKSDNEEENGEDEEEDSEYNLFAPNAGLNDDEMESEDEKSFFRPPDNVDSTVDAGDTGKKDTENDYSDQSEADEMEDRQNESEKNHDTNDTTEKTPYQQELQKRQEQISDLEKEIVGQKHWSMKGETTSSDRPQNSLLEATVEYDQVSKPAPMITSEKTSSLEELIKQRIRDEAFDDVERQLAPTEEKQLEAKHEEEKPELSAEKSKSGLGDVYEAEYLQRAMGASSEKDKKEQRLEEEVKTLFNELRRQLDSLSNFHYTPTAEVEELDVESKPNVPALSMEEVLPTAVSESQQKAPEEVHKPINGRQKSLRSKLEMDPQEKTSSRRSSKAQKRKRKRQRAHEQKLLAQTNPHVANKQNQEKIAQQISASNKVIQATQSDTSSKNYTKSSKFFHELQQSVQKELTGGQADKVALDSAPTKRRRKNKKSEANSAATSLKL